MPPAHRPEPTTTWEEMTKLTSSFEQGLDRTEKRGAQVQLLSKTGRPILTFYDPSGNGRHLNGPRKTPGGAAPRHSLPEEPIGLQICANWQLAERRIRSRAQEIFIPYEIVNVVADGSVTAV